MSNLNFYRRQMQAQSGNLNNPEEFRLYKGHLLSGFKLAERNYYPSELLEQMPPELTNTFLGTGNPFLLGSMPVGSTVIDVGSGGGMDAYLASRMVGPTGKVYGIECSKEMLNLSIRMAKFLMARNLTFLHAFAEHIPLPDNIADMVISNGVINVNTEFEKTLQEIFRVLRPGGRIQIADAIVTISPERTLRELHNIWSQFRDSDPEVIQYRQKLIDIGFSEIEFSRFWPVIMRGRLEGQEIHFAMIGGHIRAVKPVI